MIGPELRSSAFQALSALAVPENRSARSNMAPAAKAFDNQRPQATAATGFPQSAATGHCSHGIPQPVRAPRRAADRMDHAAMPRSSKVIRKARRQNTDDDAAPDDRTRQTTEDTRRRHEVNNGAFVFKLRLVYAVLAPSVGVADSQNTRGLRALPKHVSH